MSEQIKSFKGEIKPGFKGPSEVDTAVVDYSLGIEVLGIAQRLYHSDFTETDKAAARVLVWSVLKPDVAYQGLPRVTKRQTNKLAKQMQQDIDDADIPVITQTAFIAADREQALKDRLQRDGVLYMFHDMTS